MNEIEAIFFDVDETLVCHAKGEVCASAREALQKLSHRGIRRVVATGRHLSELSTLPVADIVFDGYITLNGQLCYDANKELTFGNAIEGAQKQALVDLFQEKPFPIMLIEKDRMYINYIDERVLEAQNAMSAWIPQVGCYEGGTVYQAVGFVSPDQKELLTRLLPGCHVTYWNTWAVDIVPGCAGKVSGICRYLEENGIDRANTMAFGDGENDMDMLKFVKIGVAMGNGDDTVKAIADYVTEPIDQDGISRALQHFGIL
ncbi:MAG: Cof-type HAD-IIB family hydrolase [Ruminococcaceae bacterium]|nr:Cof-type HAD-IIB family hydrolase [Oscillospiraceae bacterium]